MDDDTFVKMVESQLEKVREAAKDMTKPANPRDIINLYYFNQACDDGIDYFKKKLKVEPNNYDKNTNIYLAFIDELETEIAYLTDYRDNLTLMHKLLSSDKGLDVIKNDFETYLQNESVLDYLDKNENFDALIESAENVIEKFLTSLSSKILNRSAENTEQILRAIRKILVNEHEIDISIQNGLISSNEQKIEFLNSLNRYVSLAFTNKDLEITQLSSSEIYQKLQDLKKEINDPSMTRIFTRRGKSL